MNQRKYMLFICKVHVHKYNLIRSIDDDGHSNFHSFLRYNVNENEDSIIHNLLTQLYLQCIRGKI